MKNLTNLEAWIKLEWFGKALVVIIFEDTTNQTYSSRNEIILEVNKIHGLNATIVPVVMQFAPRSYDDEIIPFLQLQIFTF